MTTRVTKKPKKKKPTKAELAQARKAVGEAKDMQEEAKKDYDKFPTSHEIELPVEVDDKDGEPTRVLIIETDKAGMIGMFMDNGNPISFNATAEEESAKVEIDKGMIRSYTEFMANVDLSDEETLEKIGLGPIAKVREIVNNFFMLRLVLDTSVELETEG